MLNPIEMNVFLQRLKAGPGLRLFAVGFCMLTATVLFFSALPAYGIDIADAPLFTKINPPPTNLMILQDDSGSMTFEILVRGAYDGEFPNPAYSDTQGFAYVFDNMGDGYNLTDPWRHMSEEDRKYWRSQWYEVNAIYYNPNVVYEPWPGYAGQPFEPADTNKPLVHPLKDKTLDLGKKAFSADGVTVPWSHYFVESENGSVYLVIIDGKAKQNEYYIVGADFASAPLDKIETLTLESNPPADIIRDHAADLQNFANWFTYYRRREFVAKAAIARVLKELEGARVGILGINSRVIVPLKPVNAVIDDVLKDETDAIIKALYDYKSSGGTPLKTGLETVGEYYRKNDGYLVDEKGDAPYPADGGACQQAFTIVVTDGFYSDRSYNPTTVGNADGATKNAAWGGGKQPYADDYQVTLADIAMHYYATDLISDMDNEVPTNKWDGAPHQHMVTFAVAFGVSGTLNPDDYVDDRTSENYMKSKATGEYVVWPKVSANRQPESIDDLWHATVNGRGVFVNAGHPQKLLEGLLQIIKDIKARQPTSAASVTVNGDYLYGKIGPDVRIFQGSYSYIDGEWAGEVRSYPLDQTTGQVKTDSPDWLASERLQARSWEERNILTFDGDHTGQIFIYDNLTGPQKAKLGPDAEAVVDFIRGKDPDSNNNRSNLLADIVHSSPVFNDGVVYVGANGGMLHAFKADDGTELFGYVPYLVFEHLKDLVDLSDGHRFYVDLTPTVKKGEKLLGGTGEQSILVGGLGKGGMGYFALDITRPSTMTAADVLWEFPSKETSAANKAAMGYSFSKPVVAKSYKLKGGDYTWVVIFGNGYNSPDGTSTLFILDAQTGEVIKNIPAGAGPDNGLSSPIAVDVDHDDVVDFVYAGDLMGNLWKFDLASSNVADWNVAFKQGAVPMPLFTAQDSKGDSQPITGTPDVMLHPNQHGLIVCFGTGIFLSESDYESAQIQTIYGIWDYGDRAFQPEREIKWSEDDDREYLGAFVNRNRKFRQLSSPYLSEYVKLLEQKATDHEVIIGGQKRVVRILTEHQPLWQTSDDPDGEYQLPDPSSEVDNDAGWYLDLDIHAGERVISDVILRDGILIVIGFIPAQSYCSSGGDSVLMELNAFTGGSIASIQFDINFDDVIDEKDLVEVEIDGKMVKVPPSGLKLSGNIQPPAIVKLDDKREKKYMSSSGGGIEEIVEKAAKIGIAYWMEIRE